MLNIDEIIFGKGKKKEDPNQAQSTSADMVKMTEAFKQLQAQISAKDNQITQLTGQVTSLSEIAGRMPQPQVPAVSTVEELTPEQLNEMEPADILAYANKQSEVKLKEMDTKYQEQFTNLQSKSNTQFGNLEMERVLAANPEYKEWIPELTHAVKNGMFSNMKTEQMFAALKGMYPDKAKTLGEKYSEGADASNFGAGMAPSSAAGSGEFELSEFDPNVDPLEAALADIKRYEQETGQTLNEILQED